MPDEKDTLTRYLRAGREALLWKLDGLSERDARWPLTPTGTNLLGLVKHVGSMEYDYFGLVFGRPKPEPMPWLEDGAEDNADLWATAEQSREWVVDFYGRACAHADATIEALDLDAPGSVPWWSPDRKDVTLHTILVHMIAETQRHAGHADILRETLDGRIGMRETNTNLPDHDAQWWAAYVQKLKDIAEQAGP
ncbi:DinB family protein [Jiangella gansuensis]|uniref:DinB family protein n=1 Tax=Jiangella gansuensis TaxID=281473 RepID=UPI0004799144|nr:DinB family protein [Jiangella gansuensis]